MPSTHLNKDNILDQIERIAVDAGEIIISFYLSSESTKVWTKNDQSPVTKADLRANDYICRSLKRLWPEIPIISEESPIPPYPHRLQFEYFWLVDPLDGTKEFINKTDEFTVNIALIHISEPIIGVVHAPGTMKTYLGQKGKGAFVKSADEKLPLKCKVFQSEKSGLRFGVSRSYSDQQTRDYIQRFNDPILVSRGSSLKFMDLCEGIIDCYPRLQSLKEWDIGASQIIVEEAGGQVTDVDGHRLQYNSENMIQKPFIALRKE